MKSDEPMVKLDKGRDPRLIPFGQLLRASGLDELPQIFNVLQGEMSLVGPRPCTTYEYEAYSPPHKERFAVLPGLTGLWQVSGKNRTTFDEMIQLDIRYGQELSLRRDLWILAKTIGVLCGQILDSIKPVQKSNKDLQGGKLTTHEKLGQEI
jgi:lipopolysaccharide/colanic/teichoic acid biosynthesis glycosyltransferase